MRRSCITSRFRRRCCSSVSGRRVLEALDLQQLDLVLDGVEAREVVLEHLVEDGVQQEVGPLRHGDCSPCRTARATP
jgi:hypothetical protein